MDDKQIMTHPLTLYKTNEKELIPKTFKGFLLPVSVRLISQSLIKKAG